MNDLTLINDFERSLGTYRDILNPEYRFASRQERFETAVPYNTSSCICIMKNEAAGTKTLHIKSRDSVTTVYEAAFADTVMLLSMGLSHVIFSVNDMLLSVKGKDHVVNGLFTVPDLVDYDAVKLRNGTMTIHTLSRKKEDVHTTLRATEIVHFETRRDESFVVNGNFYRILSPDPDRFTRFYALSYMNEKDEMTLHVVEGSRIIHIVTGLRNVDKRGDSIFFVPENTSDVYIMRNLQRRLFRSFATEREFDKLGIGCIKYLNIGKSFLIVGTPMTHYAISLENPSVQGTHVCSNARLRAIPGTDTIMRISSQDCSMTLFRGLLDPYDRITGSSDFHNLTLIHGCWRNQSRNHALDISLFPSYDLDGIRIHFGSKIRIDPLNISICFEEHDAPTEIVRIQRSGAGVLIVINGTGLDFVTLGYASRFKVPCFIADPRMHEITCRIRRKIRRKWSFDHEIWGVTLSDERLYCALSNGRIGVIDIVTGQLEIREIGITSKAFNILFIEGELFICTNQGELILLDPITLGIRQKVKCRADACYDIIYNEQLKLLAITYDSEIIDFFTMDLRHLATLHIDVRSRDWLLSLNRKFFKSPFFDSSRTDDEILARFDLVNVPAENAVSTPVSAEEKKIFMEEYRNRESSRLLLEWRKLAVDAVQYPSLTEPVKIRLIRYDKRRNV
jgi:hypothetical protein